MKGLGFINLIDHMGSDLTVVNAARVSMGKRHDKLTDDDIKLIAYLAKHRHTTPFEHVTLQFHIKCPIFVVRQWHRHRTWSYNEISRRYVRTEPEFYEPTELRLSAPSVKQGSSDETINTNAIVSITDRCLEEYNRLLRSDVAPELARMVLPQNMLTEFYGTVNLKNLADFYRLRIDEHAQQEIRWFAREIDNAIPLEMAFSWDSLIDNRGIQEC